MTAVPGYLVRRVKSERLRRLIDQVWQRLPAWERHVLRERLLYISDGPRMEEGDNSGIAYAEGISKRVTSGCAALAVEDLPFTITLCRVAEAESDAACMWIIAHELAHIVLRHPEMTLLLESLCTDEPDAAYTVTDLLDLWKWQEDQADLQAWLWGFRDEHKAATEAFPKARRARWFVDAVAREPAARGWPVCEQVGPEPDHPASTAGS